MFAVIKLALDNQISKKAIAELRARGFNVVFQSKHEPDEIWIEVALKRGANVFVSPDLDIPNYLDSSRSSAVWIDLPQRLGGIDQAGYIISQIIKLRKKEVTISPEYRVIQLGKHTYVVERSKIDEFLLSTTNEQRMSNCYSKMWGNSTEWGSQSNKKSQK